MNNDVNCRILLIEDEPDLRDTLKELLEMQGYQVCTAENGKVGLERLLESDPPCLILLDLMMPVMNGWQFLEEIKTRHQLIMAQTPVVVVSAASDVAGAQSSYGCDYMRKPVDLHDLFDVARKHCTPA